MAGMVERVRGRALAPSVSSSPAAAARDMSLSLDEWASYFSFGGLQYPLIQTTLGSVDKERIVGNAIASLQGVSSVFALIHARVQAFSQIRFQWTRFTGAQPGDLFGTEDLAVLEHPWPGGHTAHLLSKMEIDNCIGGNSYTVRPRRNRLARLRPDLVTICLGSQYDMESPADSPDVEVAGYAYFPRSGKPEWFWPWEVAHYAPLPDPNFQFLGMSWLTPLLREVQSDALMTEHKYRYFANASTPNLAVKFDPAIPIEMVKAFKELMENEHRGAFNAWKTLYLGGGADVTVVGAQLKDLDYAVVQGHGEARLAAAAGVPPSWVGFSEGLQGSSLNAGNFQAQRRRFSDGPQPLDARVLTPLGWSTMGDMTTGCQVIGSDGRPHLVTGVYDQDPQDVWRVSFSDGTSAECSLGHLWTVRDRERPRQGWQTLPLRDILDTGFRRGERAPRWAVPLAEPVEFPGGGWTLPVDPYLLGRMLGDGTFIAQPRLTVGAEDVEETEQIIAPMIPAGVTVRREDRADCSVLYFASGTEGVATSPGAPRAVMTRLLAEMGLRGVALREKFIPYRYQRAQVKDRVALLQGLIDSDGTITAEGSVRFCNSSSSLISGVLELARSLGANAWIRQGHGQQEVAISRLPAWVVPARLSRKAARFRPGGWARVKSMTGAEYTRTVPTRCIRVDTADRLYVTDGYTLTHNTMQHLWMMAAHALESVVPPPDSHANLWFDSRVPFMRDDATDIAAIQLQQAQTISALVMQGYDPDSVVKAVANNDMTRLKHSGLMSVQLHPPGTAPPVAKAPSSANGSGQGSGAGVKSQAANSS